MEIEALLKNTIGLDTASVGTSTIERAVRQRLVVTGLQDLPAYLEKVHTSPVELQELVEAVVVSETWFFRDPEAFTVLGETVLQNWLPAHSHELLRILSIPCATGEEPYSIAMALDGIGLPAASFHIDAVDISHQALARARKAIYGRNSFRGRNLEFREQYFEAQSHGYRLRDWIRDRVLFQRENLFGPDFFPGSHLFQFIFCRNLLIYFDQEAQDRAIRTLKRLLTPDGLLFVGPAEAALMLRHDLVSIKRPLAFGFRKQVASPRKPSSPSRPVIRRHKPVIPTRPIHAQRAQAKSQRVAILQPAPTHSDKSAAELKRARELADGGQLAEALRLCQAWIKDFPPSAEAFHLLGVIHDATGDAPNAEIQYRKALYLNPDHEECLMHLAYLLDLGGNGAAARQLRTRAQRIKERTAEHA